MSEENTIYVLGKRVLLRQPDDGFRTSMDSVMLAAACPAGKGQRILDLGCGVGGAGLCVLERVGEAHLTGLDIQRECADLAVINAQKNGMEGRCEFVCGDMREYREGGFDQVICNPPYLEHGAHTSSPSPGKAISIGHIGEENTPALKDWLDAAFHNLKSKGGLTVIHRADALDRIIRGLGRRFGGLEIIPLWPRISVPAKRVIVRCIKDSRSPASVLPGIILHNEDGSYTKAAEKILSEGRRIP